MTNGPVRMLASDIDGTLLGDEAAAERFRHTWHALNRDQRPLLVYNSARTADDMLSLVEAMLLPRPDYVIAGVGTVIADMRMPGPLQAFLEELGPPFEAQTIAAVMQSIEGAVPQPQLHQLPHKISWHLADAPEAAITEIAGLFAASGLAVKLVYSSRRDLDIVPTAGGKGGALGWICRRLSIGLDEVVVAGDSGNDREMFEMPYVRGVVVANALSELRDSPSLDRRHFLASACHADGVIEGLKYWGALR
ncbi:HAD-IIB family hydrolase [Sinorhizobium alkalisoli]|uniref:Mannosylfructose-phosphate phosphatase n=1 Tax=Sinorhizobium alkalisoli TaxID=1752398 RepID=A0A1E3VCT6_9HYPH|nr:HAD-IIB family hydrolase [Sinorhizobium alkalisoli]MCG5479897.1 HAD-IIB family hydrolase [Sinorhizobium alkalisoli]ODR91400.1 mannosylfructose-phosphate phosphatase [Sinorhizobium alkalisoli]